MAPSKTSWDAESDESSSPSSPPTGPVVARRGKFEDEEDSDSDVLESWDAAEDSEAEREKAKKAAEAKARADAAAKANHKSKSQRIEEKRQENARRRQKDEEDESSEEEDEADKRARLRASEKESDLAHAEDLFGGVGGVPNTRSAAKPITVQTGPGDSSDPTSTLDLSSLKLFQPSNAAQFATLRDTLVPLLLANAKKPSYASFLQEFCKQIVRDLNSDQVKKVASALTTISNEKMKEEKAADKGGKKSKAAKTKVALSATRDVSSRADVTSYDDGLADDDFM